MFDIKPYLSHYVCSRTPRESECVAKFHNDVRCFQVLNSTTQNVASAETSSTDSPVSPSKHETSFNTTLT
jgi:hypothetical protein